MSNNESATVGTGRQRRVPVKVKSQAMGDTVLNIHAVKPRTRAVRIAGKIEQRPAVQEDRVTHQSSL
jgi:hypothetical protein